MMIKTQQTSISLPGIVLSIMMAGFANAKVPEEQAAKPGRCDQDYYYHYY